MNEENTGSIVCFLDTETDGLHDLRIPWEIAMIRRLPGGRELQTTKFVEVDLEHSDVKGLRIGGFYDRHPLGRWISGVDQTEEPPSSRQDGYYIEADAAARLVARWTHDAFVIGQNPGFDTETLSPLLRMHGLAPSWQYRPLDVTTLAAGFLCGRGSPWPMPWKSHEISEAVGVAVPQQERHTALGDARWAAQIWDRVTAVPGLRICELPAGAVDE